MVAGMVSGADSIDDMRLLRHGGMGRVFTGRYAPSTKGSFLRSFSFGHVRQLDAVAARYLAGLAVIKIDPQANLWIEAKPPQQPPDRRSRSSSSGTTPG